VSLVRLGGFGGAVSDLIAIRKKTRDQGEHNCFQIVFAGNLRLKRDFSDMHKPMDRRDSSPVRYSMRPSESGRKEAQRGQGR
jgi:hypothetical protein